jgi:hypothetical protein
VRERAVWRWCYEMAKKCARIYFITEEEIGERGVIAKDTL